MDLNAVLRRAVESGARDVHLKVGQPPIFRYDGELSAAAALPKLSDVELASSLDQLIASAPRRRQVFDEAGELDIAYSSG